MVLDTIKKNMKEKKQENSKFLKKKRKYIETVFSKLVNLFDIERIRVQSILGFRLRLEQCLLVYDGLYNEVRHLKK